MAHRVVPRGLRHRDGLCNDTRLRADLGKAGRQVEEEDPGGLSSFYQRPAGLGHPSRFVRGGSLLYGRRTWGCHHPTRFVTDDDGTLS